MAAVGNYFPFVRGVCNPHPAVSLPC
jgi:hypothetical protein